MASKKKKTTKTTKKQKKRDKKQSKKDSIIKENSIITLTLKWSDIKPVYKQAVKTLSKNLDVKGFRKGKIPQKVAEEKLKFEEIVNQTLQSILPDKYEKKVKKEKKKPITLPKFKPISVNKGKDWKIEAHFAEALDFKLGDYKKMVKEAKKKAQEEIKKVKTKLKKSKTKKKKKSDKTQQKTDISDQEEKDLTLQHIFKQLLTEVQPPIQKLLLEEQTKQELQNFGQQLKAHKTNIQDYLKKKGMTLEELSNQTASNVLSKLQLDFILNKIQEKEDIKVTKKDIQNKMDEIQNDQLKAKLKQDKRYKERLKAVIRREKTIEHLYNL